MTWVLVALALAVTTAGDCALTVMGGPCVVVTGAWTSTAIIPQKSVAIVYAIVTEVPVVDAAVDPAPLPAPVLLLVFFIHRFV